MFINKKAKQVFKPQPKFPENNVVKNTEETPIIEEEKNKKKEKKNKSQNIEGNDNIDINVE